MPRLAVPQYLEAHQGLLKNTPPGHRFQLYFKGWDLGDDKRTALKEICSFGYGAKILSAIHSRQDVQAKSALVHVVDADLTAPLATGLGNPHPVENGFSFLSPYGIPYLPGSGVKGVVRRAAEELALFHNESSWTIPFVWALFGFEAGSAYLSGPLNDAPDVVKEEAERWCVAFARWLQREADNDGLLRAWLNRVRSDREDDAGKQGHSSSAMIQSWVGRSGEKPRREVHWQGMLRFWDAFPDENAQLAVDILNPHHKDYYEGNSTPHDAAQPKPVFFLVVKPGACFRFHIEVKGHEGLLEQLGDWKGLVSEAFAHAFDWLGFGAKTAVGYGAMTLKLDGGQVCVDDSQVAAPEVQQAQHAQDRRSTVETLVWNGASLTWSPGNATLTAAFEGKKALLRLSGDRAIVPQELHEALFQRKKSVSAKVTVIKDGNNVKITAIEA